ncbi:MAG: hypothetical protein IT427_17905 [Pirellulales bacterium]|nr:hypothetical protein [Pirellulales bacterium]
MFPLLAEMSDQEKLVRAGILFAIMAAVIAVGAFVVSKFRGREDDEQPGASELLSNFRELHEEGELSDQEFRKIKTLLAEKLEQELSDSGRQVQESQREDSAESGESVGAD